MSGMEKTRLENGGGSRSDLRRRRGKREPYRCRVGPPLVGAPRPAFDPDPDFDFDFDFDRDRRLTLCYSL